MMDASIEGQQELERVFRFAVIHTISYQEMIIIAHRLSSNATRAPFELLAKAYTGAVTETEG